MVYIDTAPPCTSSFAARTSLPGTAAQLWILCQDCVFPKDRICFVFHSLVSYFGKLCSLTYFRLIPWPLSIHHSHHYVSAWHPPWLAPCCNTAWNIPKLEFQNCRMKCFRQHILKTAFVLVWACCWRQQLGFKGCRKITKSCMVLVFILCNSHEPICQLTLNCWTCLEVKGFTKQNNYLTCKTTLRLQQKEMKK